MHANSVLLTQDGTNMAKQNNPKPKQRAVGGLAGLSKTRAEADKRIKAMTPTQRKAYQSQNKKNAVKAVATAASMIPAVRGAKAIAAGAKAISKTKKLTTTMKTTGQLKNEGSKFEFTTKANSIKQGKKISTKYANQYAGQTKDKAINVVTQQKATGIKDAKGLSQMKKALSTSKGPNRTTPASRPLTRKEKGLTGGNLPRQLMKKKNQPRKVFP